MKITAREAARLLAVAETQVYRWVDGGSIPHYLVNHQPRFARTELLEWATARRLPVSPELFQTDEGEPAPALADALARGGIHRALAGDTREAVLRAAVARIPGLDAADRALLGDLLSARGSAGCTALGDGIAIPHVRSPVVCPGQQAAVSLCFLASPLPVRALDGQPAHTLFLIVSPAIATHLQLLSKLSLALLDPGCKEVVARRASDEDILAQIRRVDARLAVSSGASPP
jgi:nitrogen PTS system EIIA component